MHWTQRRIATGSRQQPRLCSWWACLIRARPRRPSFAASTWLRGARPWQRLCSSGIQHFVYVSVAHPAPMMKAYIEVRAECEPAIQEQRPECHDPAPLVRPGPRPPLALRAGPWLLGAGAVAVYPRRCAVGWVSLPWNRCCRLSPTLLPRLHRTSASSVCRRFAGVTQYPRDPFYPHKMRLNRLRHKGNSTQPHELPKLMPVGHLFAA